MKKLLTIALAIICMAVLAGLAAGQGAQQKDKQKNPPTSRETKPPPPKPPTTINSTKGNTFRLATKVMKGTVMKVDDKAKNFTVKADDGKELTFLATALKALPKPAQFVEVTYTETSGGLQATTITVLTSKGGTPGAGPTPPEPQAGYNTVRSNIKSLRLATKVMKGTVTKVDEKKKAFTVKGEDGKESTFSGAELKALPKPAQFVEVTYTETSGVLKATTVKGSKSNADNVSKAKDKPKAGETTLKKPR